MLLPNDDMVAPFEMVAPVVLPVTTEEPIRKATAAPFALMPVPLLLEIES